MKKISILSSQEYRLFIENIKLKIRSAQVKASFSVNAELIRLYWDIGRSVIDRQNKNGWGTSVIEQLCRPLNLILPNR